MTLILLALLRRLWKRVVSPPIKRALGVTVGLGALLVLLPAAQTFAVREVPPGLTWTMVDAALDGQRDGKGLRTLKTSNTPLASLPRCVPGAFVAAEDQSFFMHYGFDFEAILKAAEHNEEGGRLRGGSTISQQVARNLFLWQERSWLRKGMEAWYTLFLEAMVPKTRILEIYLQIAEMGPRVFGIGAASRHWYGKPPTKLTCREAAALASLLPSPRVRSPESASSQRRASWILSHPAPLPKSLGAR